MKLYGDLLSPFVRMSLVTALECGLGTRVQLVSTLVKPHEANPVLTRLSPIGKVPALETDHGHPLYDSRVIMEYFCHVAGNKVLLADDGAKHFKVLTLLALAQGMGDAAVALRYETFARPETARWAELTARLRQRVGACMDEMELHWLELLGEVNLGTIAAAVVLGYIDLRELAPDWRKSRKGLAQWHEAFAKRESMVNTVPRT
jgi:glutathione S-transferase